MGLSLCGPHQNRNAANLMLGTVKTTGDSGGGLQRLLGRAQRPWLKRNSSSGPAEISVTCFLVFSLRSACCHQETAVTCMAIWDMSDFLIPLELDNTGHHPILLHRPSKTLNVLLML